MERGKLHSYQSPTAEEEERQPIITAHPPKVCAAVPTAGPFGMDRRMAKSLGMTGLLVAVVIVGAVVITSSGKHPRHDDALSPPETTFLGAKERLLGEPREGREPPAVFSWSCNARTGATPLSGVRNSADDGPQIHTTMPGYGFKVKSFQVNNHCERGSEHSHFETFSEMVPVCGGDFDVPQKITTGCHSRSHAGSGGGGGCMELEYYIETMKLPTDCR